MKRTATVLAVSALLIALGAAGVTSYGQKETASRDKFPSAPLHKSLEKTRMALAEEWSTHTVSVEIDYERDGLGENSDPFFRYDLGPFSGLIVDDDQVLISDRCLGDFNKEGAAPSVKKVTITLANGVRMPASVMGRHQLIDLALLKVEKSIPKACPELSVVKLSKDRPVLERGEGIVVVGRGQNPLGLLVNDGIVSALEREIGRAFQIDARIGNSTLGAPVVTINGELVGVVTLHNHQTFGQASGVSYAAYISEVASAYDALKEGKFLPRPPAPFMGVGAQKKWKDKPGLEIGNVIAGSGAQTAGLRNGDVILKIGDVEMDSILDLQKEIAKHKVGDEIEVLILRGEQERKVTVTLGERP